MKLIIHDQSCHLTLTVPHCNASGANIINFRHKCLVCDASNANL